MIGTDLYSFIGGKAAFLLASGLPGARPRVCGRVAGENRKDDLQAALRSRADYILLPHQSYSPCGICKSMGAAAECDCLAGTHVRAFPLGSLKCCSPILRCAGCLRAPAFVLIQADKLTPLLDCIPEKGPSAGAFLAAAAEYAGLSVKWVPCASGEAAGAAFTWFLLHIFTAYGSYLHVSEHMRALEASTEEKPDHATHSL